MRTKFKRWFFQDMPQSATRDEWQDWEDQARKNKVRWFLADTFPFWCWKTFVKPIKEVKSLLRYRTFDRYHIIKTTLKPDYYDDAQEIKYLYTWWKDVRPHRPDPDQVSGWDKVCDKWNILSDKDNCEEKKSEVDAARKKYDALEKEYEDEDTRMMKRLIDVRKALWT
jgi:hypothetical protein